METLLQTILATANMQNYNPNNLRPGLKGGIFVGIVRGIVLPAPVGNVECTEINSETFGAKGHVKIDAFGIKLDEKFDGDATITGPTSAKVTEKLRGFSTNVVTIPTRDKITYIYNDGKVEATVEQTFANQNIFRGSFTEFWITHNMPGIPNLCVRLWWERT